MLELFALIIVILAVIALLRPGKARQLDTPIIVQRDQYHITLAPQLSAAQPFIEAIAEQINASAEANSATLCFEVYNQADHPYLLAITQRTGKLYCQAITPPPLLRDSDSHFNQLMEFAAAVMVNIPAGANDEAEINQRIISAASRTAQEQGSSIRQLLP